MSTRAIPAFLAALLLATPLCAQMGRGPMRISGSPGFGSGHHARTRGSGFLDGPFWSDVYYAPSPNVVVVQPPPAPVERPSPPVEEHRASAPLPIEWQGYRYVRPTSDSTNTSRTIQPDSVAETKPQPP